MVSVNKFECDKTKARSNLVKHGLRFTEGCRIFDGLTLTAESKHNQEIKERRFVTIGALDDQSTAVLVWTERKGNIRVISVRKASQKEREAYYAHIKKTIN
ncbi:BrnT family toxin [Methylophilus methylotrophus]|uniref:BrnT family toxin n=1 Tax=Methylophilus methylotrophus TaxID=17 RepID=UPI00036D5D05|nr:BrnT family toxin [Methylophilus methylotrophus]